MVQYILIQLTTTLQERKEIGVTIKDNVSILLYIVPI